MISVVHVGLSEARSLYAHAAAAAAPAPGRNSTSCRPAREGARPTASPAVSRRLGAACGGPTAAAATARSGWPSRDAGDCIARLVPGRPTSESQSPGKFARN